MADEIPGPSGNLDSSLKKHTNLLNKLKTNLLASPPDALLKDIDGLTLTKYLEEIVAAVVEGAGKGKGDPESAIEVSSLTRTGTRVDNVGNCAITHALDARLSAASLAAFSCCPGSTTSPVDRQGRER